MDERTHFYSVVASALETADIDGRAKIQAIFERDTQQKAEDIITEIAGIIGWQKMYGILRGLDEVTRQENRINELIRRN